jgi:hypothetical protein
LDLPTYTNIWRIEKRLYKLYDFRLPMPLPVGQIAVFAAIAVPYVVILKLLGLPFSHTLLWLYILPPGALAWLVTRPVLESKRLPELVVSQLRYLSEPRTWCRMAPLAEKEQIVITARVWRRVGGELEAASRPLVAPAADAATADAATAAVVAPAAAAALAAEAVTAAEAAMAAEGPALLPPPVQSPPGRAAAMRRRPAALSVPAQPEGPAPRVREAPATPAWPDRPARATRAPAVAGVPAPDHAGRGAQAPAVSGVPAADRGDRAVPVSPVPDVPARDRAVRTDPVPATPVVPAPEQAARAVPAPAVRPGAPPRPRPVVTVTGDQDAERPLRVVERALGNPSERRGGGWHDHVVVVPGGHRPGRPDQVQRDRARARLPIRGGHRVVVLGCTVGAGQTVTTLLAGELLTSLRDDPVAVLDLNPGEGSLAERARAVPALTGSRPPAPSQAEVITREAAGRHGSGEDLQDVTRVFELLSARYPVTLADPGAAAVPRVLMAADQLVLVAPASQDAASAFATTREWLEAHGHAELADGAITVLNGVSRHTMSHVEQAEALARGRCRAIVRIPWDDHLKNPGPERISPPDPVPPPPRPAAESLTPAALHAYTALAGVLIAALAAAPEQLQRARP